MVGLFALNSVRFRVPMQIGGLIGGCVPLNSGMFFATLLEDLCPKILRGIVPPPLHTPMPIGLSPYPLRRTHWRMYVIVPPPH